MSTIDLDIAVKAAEQAQTAAYAVESRSCGVMYPFGTTGEASCPVCAQPVYMHLGFPDQRPIIAEMEYHGHLCGPGCPC